MKKIFLVFCLGFVSTMAPNLAWSTFLPLQDIKIDVTAPAAANIDEATFLQVVKSIQAVYTPIVSNVGGKLSIQPDWKNETPNANSSQLFGSWVVRVTGGLARRPELNVDGLTLIICHELGHHLGGFPFATNLPPFGGYWAANEGQADYYASQVCAHRMWSADTAKNADFRNHVLPFVKAACDQTWKSEDEQNLCYRTASAIEEVTNTMAALKKEPMAHFDTPDTKVVTRTDMEHPATQCRMDTSFQASICGMAFNDAVVPGKGLSKLPNDSAEQQQAALYSCMKANGAIVGLRSACWFKE